MVEMTIEQKVIIDWYQKQYDATKEEIQKECSRDWFWDQPTAEEQMIKQLIYMTQLRNMIDGMKKAIKGE